MLARPRGDRLAGFPRRHRRGRFRARRGLPDRGRAASRGPGAARHARLQRRGDRRGPEPRRGQLDLLIVWLTVAIYWLASLAVPGLASIQGLWAPVALAAVILQFAVPSNHLVQYGGDPLFTLHFAIAMLAYSLFIVATMHSLVMLAEEKWLHRGVMPPFLRSLPPLLEMESLLFRILIAAFVLLTLTVVSGVFFSEQLFKRPFQLTHKTVFGMISWVIFGWLLAGRYFQGWRGRRAVYWTLGGFAALLLAYIGSKFVLEIILKRA
ncbi:MAG: cytochrome c biogenesis protein CcsA [Betaproteobacteria bacterium]|nr:cytochrome c biogenesis protein CcsA [Betaproteobacteria bacterium]